MAGRYFIETYMVDGLEPTFHEEFEQFEAAFAAAKAKAALQPDQQVRFHLPSSATDAERKKVDEANWKPI